MGILIQDRRQHLRNETSLPPWAPLVSADADWLWRGSKLIHKDALGERNPQKASSALRRFIVRHVYATQNSSATVKRELKKLLSDLGADDWGLNLGAGGTRLHDRVLNLDICDAPGIDVIARGQNLPFRDETLSLVFSQEVLEHLPSPEATVNEVKRVLRKGGRFYCQVPFIIGYHPGPTDFWRFTREGLMQLFSGGDWRIENLDISLGHGSGFYRIAVEYLAVTCSALSAKLYLPAKALAALTCLPLKWPDLFAHSCPQKDRIPGGYFCVARKI